uniref:CPBP family glutamic-type intramembrane protease n=1 Tax=Paenibacillus sp. FSL H8-0332 TaxID=2954742 RepID=UPI00403F948F
MLTSSFLFWIIHVPQYKGVYVAYLIVFMNGLIFALLFYSTGSLIPAILGPCDLQCWHRDLLCS